MDLGSEYQLIDTWVAEYILRNDLNPDDLPTYKLCPKGYIMKILKTVLSILKDDKDASRLPLVTTLLQELIGKIEKQSLRLKILECFLSLKLKIALDTLSRLQKSKFDSSYGNLDGLLVVKEEFLATLKEPEVRGVRKHVEEMKVWIKKYKNQLIPLCQKEGAKETCVKEFEVVMKETKEVLGKSFIEELASAVTTAMQKNTEILGAEQHPFSDLTARNLRKRKYAWDESCTDLTTKRARKSDEDSDETDEKIVVFDNSPALRTQFRGRRIRRRGRGKNFTRTKGFRGSGTRDRGTRSPCLIGEDNSAFTSVKPSGEDKSGSKALKTLVMDKAASRLVKSSGEDRSASRDHSASMTSVGNTVSRALKPSVKDKSGSRLVTSSGEDKSASRALNVSGRDNSAPMTSVGNIASRALKPSVTDKSVSRSVKSLGEKKSASKSVKPAGEDKSASRASKTSGRDQAASMTAVGNIASKTLKPSSANNSTETLLVTVHNNSSDREVTFESSFNGSNVETPSCEAKIVDNDYLDLKSSEWREQLNEPIPSRNSIGMFTDALDGQIESQKNHTSFYPECVILPKRPSTAKHASAESITECRNEVSTISERIGLFGTPDGRHAVSNCEDINTGNGTQEQPEGVNGNDLLVALDETSLYLKKTLLDSQNTTATDSKNRSPSIAELNISDDDMEGSSPILISTPKRSNKSMGISPTQSQSQQSTPNSKDSDGQGSETNTPQRHGFVDCIDRGIKQLELAINCIRKGFNNSLEKLSNESSSQTSQTRIKESPKTSFVCDPQENVATPGKTANSKKAQRKKSQADEPSIPLIEISSDSDVGQDSDQTNYSSEFTSTNKVASKEPMDSQHNKSKKTRTSHNPPSCGIDISQDDSFRLSISSDSSDIFLDDYI